MKKAPLQWAALSPRLREQALLAAGWDAAPFLRRIVLAEPEIAAPLERALAKLADDEADPAGVIRSTFRVVEGERP